MSYVVLARKYRPRNFAEMVGQEHVVTALGNALTTQRLHHAYLFTGTRGVGKTTVSRILASPSTAWAQTGRAASPPRRVVCARRVPTLIQAGLSITPSWMPPATGAWTRPVAM